MGKRTKYDPGTFSFVDLTTTDIEGAKSFYSDLFGWTHETSPAGETGEYTMFSKDGLPVAGGFQQSPEMTEQGAPPAWLSYVTVENVDKAATNAQALGANVISAPFDVLDAGRMAVIMDPQGAVFAVWEPRKHPGAGLVNEPGSLTWNELRSPDPKAALPFYEQLFGWSAEESDMGGGMTYVTHKVGDRVNGGMIPTQIFGEGVPPHWGVYFTVEDTDKATARVQELGGKLLAPPMDVPMGRFAALTDPQGAYFSIFSGNLDP